MKKIVVIILIVAVIIGAYILVSNKKEAEPEVNNILASENTASREQITVSENSEAYKISEGSTVSYSAQKEFFSKPTEVVVGTTPDVEGEIYVDSENKIISLNANINPQTLESGSGSRDKYVRGEFEGLINVAAENITFETLEDISITAPVVLTINGVSSLENFEITGSVKEGTATFSGSTNVKMSDFNINPPSLANVYVVEDVIEVSFDLNVIKI